jgi:hypothetical protein
VSIREKYPGCFMRQGGGGHKCDESGKTRDDSAVESGSLPRPQPLSQLINRNQFFMSTATNTSHDTGQHTIRRATTQPSNTLTTQLERSAAQRLRTTMAAVRIAFTWLGVRKTLAP